MLGYVVNRDGVEADPEKIKRVQEARLPNSKKKLRSFLMFCFIKQRLLRGFSHISTPLHTSAAQESEFELSDHAMEAFDLLRAAKGAHLFPLTFISRNTFTYSPKLQNMVSDRPVCRRIRKVEWY